MSDDDDGAASPPPPPPHDDVDENTLRVMVSTDNHLGYCEKDPVRGLDSFAAFEEVLSLARRHKCDMVLFAGDLFHENKPTRRTLHKSIDIIRRYCMGPNPVQVQVVSDQAANFRSVFGTVNYEDEFYSIDLPIFSIHGNHDDPTREGGTEMLAALDILAVSNLVNYFGRQDKVDKVEVSPVLLRKGSTRVALYGMGSMRDERLNRMWRGKKVRFLRPENEGGRGEGDEDDDDDEEDGSRRRRRDGGEEADEDGWNGNWFNVFALHQNRDLGRGSKNCVHESMIPEWMDLVVWGHEHECAIEPVESVVGTYRISQPGSSVATSLIQGEAVRKQVGILDIRGSQFRLRAIPLSQVRAFAMGEISLRAQQGGGPDGGLDPEDPRIDDRVDALLAQKVEELVEEAREKSRLLREDAEALAVVSADDRSGTTGMSLKFKLQKPDEVLVRLKVEHSGFSTLNNQKFGARFVGEVANPSDLLLFHRRRHAENVKEGGGRSGAKKGASALDQPLPPEELEQLNIEDLVKDNLDTAAKKLEVLDQRSLGLALEKFVDKEQTQAFPETIQDGLNRQQKKLIKRFAGVGDRGDDTAGTGGGATATAIREICVQEAEKARADAAVEEEEEMLSQEAGAHSQKRKRVAAVVTGSSNNRTDDSSGIESGSDDAPPSKRRTAKRPRQANVAKSTPKPRPAASTRVTTAAKNKTGRGAAPASRGRKAAGAESDDSDEIEVVESPEEPSRSTSRPARRANARKAKYTFSDDDLSDRGDGRDDSGDSDAAISVGNDDDEEMSDVEVEEVPPKRRGRKGGAAAASRARGKSQNQPKLTVETPASSRSRSDASFTSTRKKAASSTSRRKAKRSAIYNDEDSDDDEGAGGGSLGLGGDWGSVASGGSSQPKRRGRR